MNYVNYANHTLYTPDTYHRRYDIDLPSKDNEADWENQAKRVALAALPYISLYQPAGKVLSITMGSWRSISLINDVISSGGKGDWLNLSIQLIQTAFAVLSVVSTIFSFSLGLALNTGFETLQGLFHVGQALRRGDQRKAAEEALQAVTSAVYLRFMLSGSLEMMLLFTLLQAATCFFQAQGDMAQGRYLEAAAKIGMGFIRLHQMNGYAQQIERRDRLFAMQKYAAFIRRALKGREVRHLLENPLAGFKDSASTTLSGVDFGKHFHGMGEDLVKGANLAFRTKIIDGKEITELDFKVNHFFRDRIQGTIDDFSTLDQKEMNEILALAKSHATGIRIEKNQPLPLGNEMKGDSTKITLEGLGSIYIGSTKDLPTMYDRVLVQMDSGKNLYDFHELMAFLDLDYALHLCAQEHTDRLKMGHLFRIFFPREATPFERSHEFFELPLDQLKAKMIEKAPEMEKIFDDHYDKMRLEEILPGRMRYRVEGLAEKAYAHGARGLTAAITGAYSDTILFERIASMLKMGMVSSELRAQGNLNINGMSTSFDFYSGGADSVFMQMVTEKNCNDHMSFNQLNYHGKARFLISLDALETGTYQYFDDSFGNRRVDPSYWNNYTSRPNILELADRLNAPTSDYWGSPYSGHEVMAKERLDPSFFTGIAVDSAQTRGNLMEYLRTHNLIQWDRSGHETILGIAADRFVRVAPNASEDLFI